MAEKKGPKYEKLLRQYYESLGWTVHQAVSTGVKRGNIYTSQTNDVFGCIDLLCKHPMYNETLYIQVTSKSGFSQRRKKIDETDIPWKEYDVVMIATYYLKGDLKDMPEGPFYQIRYKNDDYELDEKNRIYFKDIHANNQS